tara:strand:- start:834 stop:2531 length:1698 start_codon:yes stop_codon:yes gene_type:complete
MPSLVDLTTDLKSLRFGRDKQGGGSSNQPYIVTPIPEGDTTGASELYGDFLLRGGALRPTIVARNTSRLVKFLTDFQTGDGVAFIAKQNLLARLNPPSIGQPNRVYDPTAKNTILQTADPTGTIHFNKDGFNLTTPYNNTYERETFNQNADFPNRNRLVKLTNNKIAGKTSSISLIYGVTNIPGNILTYNGGAGSVGGFGTTKINRVSVTDQNSSYIQLGNGISGTRDNTTTPNLSFTNRTISDLSSTSPISGTRVYQSEATTILTDFREQIKEDNPVAATKLVSSNYRDFNRQSTYSITDSGNRSFIRTDQYKGALSEIDKNPVSDPVTMKSIYSSDEVDKEVRNSDFIKFWIARLDNDSITGTKEYIHLRAYLSGISDSFQAGFNSFKYVGRAETFKTYNSFDRSFNFTLKVAALSKVELAPIITKLNYIASLTAPDYSSGGFMRSNIVYLTLGDYLNNVPGFIESVNITIPDDTSFEIARGADGEPEETTVDGTQVRTQQLPKYAEMQINFKPIHSILPEVGARFIGQGGRTVPSPLTDTDTDDATNNFQQLQEAERVGIFQ